MPQQPPTPPNFFQPDPQDVTPAHDPAKPRVLRHRAAAIGNPEQSALAYTFVWASGPYRTELQLGGGRLIGPESGCPGDEEGRTATAVHDLLPPQDVP